MAARARRSTGACVLALLAGCGQPAEIRDAELDTAHETLVRGLASRGITDPRVLAAMRRVPRHAFVPDDLQDVAYADRALPIGHRQTISQPYIVAFMTQALQLDGDEVVLEIGTGSGYQAAVLAELGCRVVSIEIVEPLGRAAAARLRRLGYDGVEVRIGDGYRGWPARAPFDAVIVTAAPDHVPQPLVDQQRPGGSMVIPVGERGIEELVLLRKTERGVERESLLPVRFVPMTG